MQRENVPKLPGVLRLLLRKTGHWPVHDIKTYDTAFFLSSLLLKEQMMTFDKKKNSCETIPSPKDIAKKAGVLRTKLPVLKTQHWFISSQCFCCRCYCTGWHSSFPPLPPAKTFVKSVQNRSLSSKVCPENFRKIDFFNDCFSVEFAVNFSTTFPWNWPFFQRPCVTNSLR